MFKLLINAPLFLIAKYFKRKPLIVTWQITGKCQSKCKYCDFWKAKSKEEMPYSLVKKTLDQLAQAGTKVIHLTGGEPLLRSNVENIIKYAKKKGFYISLNSNGILLPKKINKIIDYIDLIKLSLDGSEKTHNKIRGVNCYDKVIESLEILKKRKKKVLITTVISKENIDNLENVLEIAMKYNCQVSFQIVTNNILLSNKTNLLGFNKKETTKVVEKLLLLKKSKWKKHINNTSSAIKQINISNKRKCYVLKIGTRINYDGEIEPCLYKKVSTNHSNNKISINKSFLDIYKNMHFDIDCNIICWCAARIETNLLFSFNLETILNIFIRKIF